MLLGGWEDAKPKEPDILNYNLDKQAIQEAKHKMFKHFKIPAYAMLIEEILDNMRIKDKLVKFSNQLNDDFNKRLVLQFNLDSRRTPVQTVPISIFIYHGNVRHALADSFESAYSDDIHKHLKEIDNDVFTFLVFEVKALLQGLRYDDICWNVSLREQQWSPTDIKHVLHIEIITHEDTYIDIVWDHKVFPEN